MCKRKNHSVRLACYIVLMLMFGVFSVCPASLLQAAQETEISEDAQEGKYSLQSEKGYRIELQDQMNLLTGEEEQKLLARMEEVAAYTNVAFVSYDNGQNTKQYVDENYDQKGFFNPGGVVFAIDMLNRNLNLRFSGDAARRLGYSRATSIEDNVYTYAADGKYFECADSAFAQVLNVYAGGRVAQPMKLIVSILLGMSLGIMILFFFIRNSRKQKKVAGSLLAGSIGTAVIAGAATSQVYKRVRNSSSSSSGGGSGGRGGGGSHHGSSGGAGHRF